MTDIGEVPESENEKFVLVGNPAKVFGYRVTRKNTRLADFVLATHPDKETTEYWHIRAFGDQAEKVRDQVEVGQKGVEVTVYGPKYWKGRKKRLRKAMRIRLSKATTQALCECQSLSGGSRRAISFLRGFAQK